MGDMADQTIQLNQPDPAHLTVEQRIRLEALNQGVALYAGTTRNTKDNALVAARLFEEYIRSGA